MTELSTPTHIVFRDDVVPWREARVHVWTEVVLRAASVFEGLRGYWNEAEGRHYWVKLPEHVARLHRSASTMRIPSDLTLEKLVDQLSRLTSTLGYTSDIYARPTVFLEKGRYTAKSGDGSEYFMPIFESERPAEITTGLAACVSSWRRTSDDSMPSAVKAAANYANFRWARMEAEADGYDEAILLNASGRVSETGGSAVFVVRDGLVSTPAVSESILLSITRQAVIDLLTEDGINVREVGVQRSDLYSADEIFLTGTLNEITPVTSVDRFDIANGQPGPLTRRIQNNYLRACRAGSADGRGWLTAGPVVAPSPAS